MVRTQKLVFVGSGSIGPNYISPIPNPRIEKSIPGLQSLAVTNHWEWYAVFYQFAVGNSMGNWKKHQEPDSIAASTEYTCMKYTASKLTLKLTLTLSLTVNPRQNIVSYLCNTPCMVASGAVVEPIHV